VIYARHVIAARFVGGGARMNKDLVESQKRLKSLLRQLFQFDFSDLDHGIYRIMNQRREEIEKFIDKDLFQRTEEAFQEYAGTSAETLQKELEELKSEINADFGAGTIDERGEIQKHKDAPKVQEYAKKQEELRSAKLTRGQIEDVYNHVYEFFSRYFDKGDFISKRRYGGKDKYVIPYNGEEVMLHWANKDQYYVKTTEYFNNLEFKIGEWKVEFILTRAELEQNNVKGDNRYFVLADEEKISLDEPEKKLTIYFQYRALNEDERKEFGTRGNVRGNIIEKVQKKILSKVKDKGIEKHLTKKEEDKTLLAKQLNMYVDKNTSDYFIHKNLREFLQRELDFYIKNEVLHLDEIAGKGKDIVDERKFRLNIARIKAIRDISESIIEFLAQIEDFQKMLFEKKKLVLRTDYCMTLDKVPGEFYEEIVDNEAQINEWKELFKLEEIEKETLHYTANNGLKIDADYLRSHPFLVLDTKFFDQEFRDRLLGTFKDLDKEIGGLIIKSENWQALNLLLERHREKIKCIYIDPPYNRGTDDFIFKDNYQHSTWLCMMKDRLEFARELLKDDGLIFSNIDDNEVYHLRGLFNILFNEGKTDCIIWKKASEGRWGKMKNVSTFRKDHEYVLVGFKEKQKMNKILEKPRFVREYNNPDNDPRGKWMSGTISVKEEASDPNSPNYYTVISPTGKEFIRQWNFSKEEFDRLNREGRISWGPSQKNVPRIKIFIDEERALTPYSILVEKGTNTEAKEEFLDLLGKDFEGIINRINPKPSKLIRTLAQLSTHRGSIVLDFFAGSGTTGHAVLNLNAEDGGNRKYIMVEMGDYFDTVMKPRIQKVMFSKKWKDGVPQSNEGHSHMFKYMYLEQYEDTLYNIVFRAKDKTIQETLETFDDYFVRYMLEYETRESATRLATAEFENPFDYKIKKVSGSGWEIEPVDLVETFNYLLGLDVVQIKAEKDGERYYRFIKGRKQNGDTTVIVWRSTKNIDLKKDKEFIEDKFLPEGTPDLIYVNGMCYVKNAKPIEPEFKRLMGA